MQHSCFLPHCLLSLLRGNTTALIGCLSQECNLTKVEQHLIAIRMLLLSSIRKEESKRPAGKIRVLLCGNVSYSVTAVLIISPASNNCRLIAKQTHRLDADVDCLALTRTYSLCNLHYY